MKRFLNIIKKLAIAMFRNTTKKHAAAMSLSTMKKPAAVMSLNITTLANASIAPNTNTRGSANTCHSIITSMNQIAIKTGCSALSPARLNSKIRPLAKEV